LPPSQLAAANPVSMDEGVLRVFVEALFVGGLACLLSVYAFNTMIYRPFCMSAVTTSTSAMFEYSLFCKLDSAV